MECKWARWPQFRAGYCANLRVKEMNTTDARAAAGSCGLNGLYWQWRLGTEDGDELRSDRTERAAPLAEEAVDLAAE